MQGRRPGREAGGPGHESWASPGLPRHRASLLLPPSKTDKECEGSSFGSECSEPGRAVIQGGQGHRLGLSWIRSSGPQGSVKKRKKEPEVMAAGIEIRKSKLWAWVRPPAGRVEPSSEPRMHAHPRCPPVPVDQRDSGKHEFTEIHKELRNKSAGNRLWPSAALGAVFAVRTQRGPSPAGDMQPGKGYLRRALMVLSSTFSLQLISRNLVSDPRDSSLWLLQSDCQGKII